MQYRATGFCVSLACAARPKDKCAFRDAAVSTLVMASSRFPGGMKNRKYGIPVWLWRISCGFCQG